MALSAPLSGDELDDKIKPDPSACEEFVSSDGREIKSDEPALQCLAALREALENIPTPDQLSANGYKPKKDDLSSRFGNGASLISEKGVRSYLVQWHTTLRHVRNRLKKIDKKRYVAEIKPKQIAPLEKKIHDSMGRYHLQERVAAAVDTGISLAETGNDSIQSARDSNTKVEARGLLKFESEHFRDDNPIGKMDFSFGGDFGLVPALTPVSVDPGDGTGIIGGKVTPTPYVTYMQGLRWDVTGRANFQVGGQKAEPNIFLRLGQDTLLADTDSFKRGTNTVLLERLHNGPGRIATFWEVGGEVRLYDGDALNLVHHDGSFLNPRVSFSGGFRSDDRFRRSGPLSMLGDKNRVFFRMAVSLNRFQNRDEAQPSKPASVQLGIDYERGGPGSKMPGGLRIFLGGDFNALNLIH